MPGASNGSGAGLASNTPAPRGATDARAMFDSLFKKSEE
jgi:hypothetical protein